VSKDGRRYPHGSRSIKVKFDLVLDHAVRPNRLLKNSVQCADLRLIGSFTEERQSTDRGLGAAVCSLKPYFACPRRLFNSLLCSLASLPLLPCNIADLVPDDWRQVVESNIAALRLKGRVKRTTM